ncbi:MAG: type II toxin-antitoxin system HicA family toxin [Anaerolineae bacterium]
MRLPTVRPDEVIRALEKDGWEIDRQTGSHVVLVKKEHATILVVPMHKRDLPRGTLRGIIKDSGLTQEEFRKLL